MPHLQKLDNPVWNSLNETHRDFSLTHRSLKCYHPDYCPFGGVDDDNDTAGTFYSYSHLINDFYVVGNRPVVDHGLTLKKELVCLQMVIDHPIEINISEEIISLDNHREALFNIVNLVQPGYFRTKTALLGDYFGIFKDNSLVAVTGERMKMDGLTEVSAVVTHPEHVGKGFAKQLIAHTVNKIFEEDRIPYLHVAETNISAIGLYEKLGFTTRRKISFWNLIADRH